MTDDADQAAAHVAAGAAVHAARQLGNDLAGLLWRRQQDATDPDDAADWRAERAAVRARQRELVPDSPAITDALREWGERIRELRT